MLSLGVQVVFQRSIRSEIEHHQKKLGYSLSKLGELTGINPGTLSDILNSNPPRAITIGQLDAMATTFGQAPGWLYELYPQECITDGKISRPRLIPYLVRCAEIDRQDCITSIVTLLLENPKNISILFSVAEQLFEKYKWKEAIPFYEYVIENEKDSYSNQFVMSQYRLFRAVQGANVEENWKAMIRFEPYRKRLLENYQLDALLHLANVSYTLYRWQDVEKYADELRELSTIIYQNELQRRKNGKGREPLKTERQLVVYYGQSYLLKAVALKNMEMYEEAKLFTKGYADLSWFEILDAHGREEIKKFQLWAQANSFTLDMLTGNLEILPQYLDFLAEHPNEVLPGLITILQSANQFEFTIDGVFERFSESMKSFNDYRDPIKIILHLHFLYQLAVYLFRNGNYLEGLDEILHCLVLSDLVKDFDYFKKCSSLFWLHLQHATNAQKQIYQAVMTKGV